MNKLVFAAAALAALGAAAGPVKVIFDTDMICDFDDVGALACLHALADAGECEILATVSSTRGNASVGAIQVINAYYGRAGLPVGAPKGTCVLGAWPGAKAKVDPMAPLGERPSSGGDGGHYKYRKLIRDYPAAVTYPDADDAPDATGVYRRALASAPDKSVVICSVGFLTNLRRLLETPSDDISPLDGRTLVARKVIRWVAMACSYPDGLEYNAEQDAESSRMALANWPTPIVFSDFQYGYDVYAGRAVADLPGPRNPVKDVFIGQLPSLADVAADPAKWRRACYGAGGRSAWDETAVLAAVRGVEPYFNVRRGFYRIVGPKGEDEWVPDEENGSHLRLTEKASKAEIGRILDDLMCRPPQSATRNAATVGRFSKAGYWEVPGSPRRITSLNPGWAFSLDDFRTAKTVNLPHSIDEGEIGFAASGGVNRQQPAWYRKNFAWNGASARQFLHFEAIMGKSRITLNGREVAAHFGGFLPIHVEVTDVLKRGENLLEVWCDNSDDPTFPPGKPQDQLDFAYFGGIYRDAYLVETGDAYVTDSGQGGVSVTSRLEPDGGWTVFADVTLGGVTNGASVRFLHDGAPVTPPFRPESPKLWSPEEPNLHLLTVEVIRDGQVVDAVGVRFGIRDFALDANGLTLNGRRYPKKLIGVNRHQDYLFIGMALPNSLHWRDAKKYRDCGMTVIRNAHYPQDPAFMDACDELGLFVVVNTPGWQFWNQDDPAFERRVYDDIVKMVRRDRARPSLLMWEPVLNETRYPAAFVTNAVRLVKRETRMPNYCACDGHAAGADVCDVRYWISVKGTVDAHRPSFCREWGDFPDDWNAQNSSSRVALEWGEGPMVAQADHYMNETAWPSLKTLCAAPPSLFGATLWHGADHARGYHPDNFFGGILSYGRQKKYAWHAFKAALTDEPYVFVAHEFAPYSPADITVYSNCAYTATWLGKPFVPGETKFRYCEMQALTYDDSHPERQRQAVLDIRLLDGSSVVKARAKRFARIDLALDTEGLAPTADGSDLVALTATLADADGTPRRYARETVVFEVEGPAEIVGENPQETRWGEAIVLIRPKAVATPQPITVRARLVRQGTYARQGGFLTFTPGSLDVRTGTRDAGEETRRLKEVEEQQRDFNVTAPAAVPSLAPVLDADVLIPNGGIFRFFDFGGFKKENMPRLVRVFGESPYQETTPLRYDRLNWFEYERGPGEYLFDAVVEPKLKKCLAERARLFLGLACNSGSISVTQMHEGRALAVPVYVFVRCAAEGHPFRPCDQYGPSWVPDYDSPYLLERHRALLNAFAAWLEGTVAGTDVKRKDVIYGIEARYAGYWGEGAMRREHYPKTDLLDAYADAYVQALPDTLICMGGHETLHLPTRTDYARHPTDAAAVRAMTHVGKVFRLRNRQGPVGFFIDSWQSPSDQYDADSPRVLFGERGEVLSLAEVLFGTLYRQRYVTGEFGYLTFLSDPSLQPYEKFPEQVATRGVSGLTLHNFTAKDRASLAGVTRVRGAHYLPGGIPLSDEVYARVRRALAGVGYRIVLGSPKVERLAQGVRASFTLTNVGVSRMFHDYNRIHLVARDAAGRVVEDRALDFRLADLPPAAKPLLWDEAAGVAFAEVFPSDVVEVRIRIPDEKGIEHPLCLSNRGRDADGAYVL